MASKIDFQQYLGSLVDGKGNGINTLGRLNHLQGNILNGHGRDFAAHVFIEITNVAAYKEWQKNVLAPSVTSALKQIEESFRYKTVGIKGTFFTTYYLSSAGLRKLGLTSPISSPPPTTKELLAFDAGLKERVTLLNDPKVEDWDNGFEKEIHAMILLADDDIHEVSRRTNALEEEIKPFAKILRVESGESIRNRRGDIIEHFGYVDGVSQPHLVMTQGEFDKLEEQKKANELAWDPRAGLELVLVEDTTVGIKEAEGSFFVFRKLEQNVRGFKEAEEHLQNSLKQINNNLPDEIAGAFVVGRFEDGTPVEISDKEIVKDINDDIQNNFNYNNDSEGNRCPVHAHVRKTNPRGSGGFEPLEEEKSHSIARRGITYGSRNIPPVDEPTLKEMPESGVGLLFMCFQASIEHQFEFMQKIWANNPTFPKHPQPVGIDPIIGQNAPNTTASQYQWPTDWDKPSNKVAGFESFVTMKGGEYFFAPDIRSL
jgi:Dyp-type peroxidase family